MNTGMFRELECCQHRKHTERICGDAFMSAKDESGRLVAALSDGLGSGVKANILASMTATMALKFAVSGMHFDHCAQIMVHALPICQVRKIAYATYSIVDCGPDGAITLIEQGNPAGLFVRQGNALEAPRRTLAAHEDRRVITRADFQAMPEDRLIFFSDGITEAGIGSRRYPLGWRREGCRDFVLETIRGNPRISARHLAAEIVREARDREQGGRPGDDMTCAVLYFRHPRNALILTGPPFDEHRDAEYAALLRDAPGKKIICGGTSAKIVSRQLGVDIRTNLRQARFRLPPTSEMPGVDLVTEGILTLTGALRRLRGEESYAGGDAADQLINLLRDSDIIDFVVGTRINEAHQDPRLPVDLEIRRNLVRELAQILEKKYLKQVNIQLV